MQVVVVTVVAVVVERIVVVLSVARATFARRGRGGVWVQSSSPRVGSGPRHPSSDSEGCYLEGCYCYYLDLVPDETLLFRCCMWWRCCRWGCCRWGWLGYRVRLRSSRSRCRRVATAGIRSNLCSGPDCTSS